MKNIFRRVKHQLRTDIISMPPFPFSQGASLLALVLVYVSGGQMAFPVLQERVCCKAAGSQANSHFTFEADRCWPWVADERQAPSAELLMQRAPKHINCNSVW